MDAQSLLKHYNKALQDWARWQDEAPWLACLRLRDAEWLIGQWVLAIASER